MREAAVWYFSFSELETNSWTHTKNNKNKNMLLDTKVCFICFLSIDTPCTTLEWPADNDEITPYL
jgi:hypothetical protein